MICLFFAFVPSAFFSGNYSPRYAAIRNAWGFVDYWVAEAVKAFEGHRSAFEMLDAFRYEITRNA